MNPLDLAYAAGFFDGEGSVSIMQRKRNGRITHYLWAAVGQNDGATLDWLKERFGGSVYRVKRDNSFYWALSDKAVYLLMRQLEPYLKYKRPQAQLAIRFYEERIDSKRKANRKASLSQEEINAREQMRQEMKRLKTIFTNSSHVRSNND